jgi:predicted enzyme related to lactoylglutathione lyase
MKVEKLECLDIWTENPDKLANWYFDLFNEKESLRLNEPDDTGVGFELGGLLIWFGYHSEVKGKSKDPFRFILEFRVDDLNEMYRRVQQVNAPIIRQPEKVEIMNCYVMTISDPDGNTIQFLGDKFEA